MDLLAQHARVARTQGRGDKYFGSGLERPLQAEIWEPSVPLQALEQSNRNRRNLLSQCPQSITGFVPVPVCLVCLSQLLLVASPHPQLPTLALVSMAIHFTISTHHQWKCPDFQPSGRLQK